MAPDSGRCLWGGQKYVDLAPPLLREVTAPCALVSMSASSLEVNNVFLYASHVNIY